MRWGMLNIVKKINKYIKLGEKSTKPDQESLRPISQGNKLRPREEKGLHTSDSDSRMVFILALLNR